MKSSLMMHVHPPKDLQYCVVAAAAAAYLFSQQNSRFECSELH